MDFTEVNFELAESMQERIKDQQTFRHLLELICHSINSSPSIKDQNLHVPPLIEKHMLSYDNHGPFDNFLNQYTPASRFFSVMNKNK